MVRSSADIVLRISQSETSTINILCDVVNKMAPAACVSTLGYCLQIIETFGYIPTNEPWHAL